MNKPLKTITLEDRYSTSSGRVLLSGIQALVRLPMEQMRRDKERGLNTGVFISGYRGSPLGGYDLELARRKDLLNQHNIVFQPGVNEELGATAVWGSQQVNLFDGATVDGVCGIWYGKTPGVDRSTDAFRHGNAAGSSQYGGVLVVAGDDHGCKSSSYPGQSEFAFVDVHMPVLNPATVQEVLDYGLYGVELSRFSGCWVAMITLSENMDSGATVDVDHHRVAINTPNNVAMPEGGLNIRLPDAPLAQEERLWRYKRPAALAFCRANNLNKVVLANATASLGIVTTGKAHTDLMQALDDLGINPQKAVSLGMRILKVGMTYPLDVDGIREFARGLDYLLVVEEKRSLIEVQLKEALYNVEVVDPHFPKIIGKVDALDKPLMPAYGELSPAVVATVLSKILKEVLPTKYSDDAIENRMAALATNATLAAKQSITSQRGAFFCSGCPHNTSTKVPEGSRALAGIGCHYLAQTMGRETYTFTQMGGEGVSWVGQSHFTKTPHVFVNLGDGTYFHSGVLAIRAAVAAKVNITYKILYNETVAMTGGQPHDGELRPDMIARQVLAEGVERLVLVMDDVNKYKGVLRFPENVQIHHRDDLDAVQKRLRDIRGVTCIIYDQTCATELRRKRKRGLIEDPQRRVIINDLVCEGCGDCSVQSNCLSVEPKATPFGLKRQINQTTCNKDLSCVNGFCPSFVTVEGGSLRKPASSSLNFISLAEALTLPTAVNLEQPWSILVTGIGGTGIVTVGALIMMAAHLEGKAGTSLDQTGLAQKGGAVYSHIRLANNKEQLHAVRIADASANALIGSDLVAAGAEATCLSKLTSAKTQSLLNTHVLPTSAFVLGKATPDESQTIINAVDERSATLSVVDAHGISRQAFGETTSANVFMLGYAFQQGAVPVSLEALHQAITINGIAVSANKKALALGRLAAANLQQLMAQLHAQASGPLSPDTHLPYKSNNESLADIIARRSDFLSRYQNPAYAKKYLSLVKAVQDKEQHVQPNSEQLSKAVAINAFKVMAYKDEYEVARLYTNGDFNAQLHQQFEGDYRLRFNLAPPLISRPAHPGEAPKKIHFGGWMLMAFRLLAACKWLRLTPIDPFGFSKERQQERGLINRYNHTITQLLASLHRNNLKEACEIAALPQHIKGYGHIKQASIEAVLPRWQRLLARYTAAEKN